MGAATFGQPTFRNFIIYQSAQALALQVLRLVVQQHLVIASGFRIVPETVIPKCKIVETFATTLRVVAEDVCGRISKKEKEEKKKSNRTFRCLTSQ